MTFREIVEILPDAHTRCAPQSAEFWERFQWMEMKSGSGLVKYDAMCRAIAAAKSVDEIKKIRVTASAMAAAARVAKNKDAEADCVEIRMRATRRLDQMRQVQAKTVGLAKGGGGKHGRKRVIEKPTLESQGIDKNLATQGRVLGKLSDKEFEQTVVDMRGAVTRAVRGVVRMRDIEQQRRASSLDEVIMSQLIGDMAAHQVNTDGKGYWNEEVHNFVCRKLKYHASNVAEIADHLFRCQQLRGHSLMKFCSNVKARAREGA
jgi:hypothetical protein